MSTLPKTTPYGVAPLVTACSLPHHRPGARVVFNEYDHTAKQSRRFTGRVVHHMPNGRRLTVELDRSGRHHQIECSAVAAAYP